MARAKSNVRYTSTIIDGEERLEKDSRKTRERLEKIRYGKYRLEGGVRIEQDEVEEL